MEDSQQLIMISQQKQNQSNMGIQFSTQNWEFAKVQTMPRVARQFIDSGIQLLKQFKTMCSESGNIQTCIRKFNIKMRNANCHYLKDVILHISNGAKVKNLQLNLKSFEQFWVAQVNKLISELQKIYSCSQGHIPYKTLKYDSLLIMKKRDFKDYRQPEKNEYLYEKIKQAMQKKYIHVQMYEIYEKVLSEKKKKIIYLSHEENFQTIKAIIDSLAGVSEGLYLLEIATEEHGQYANIAQIYHLIKSNEQFADFEEPPYCKPIYYMHYAVGQNKIIIGNQNSFYVQPISL